MEDLTSLAAAIFSGTEIKFNLTLILLDLVTNKLN